MTALNKSQLDTLRTFIRMSEMRDQLLDFVAKTDREDFERWLS